ncbi:uncharacterized protein LOC141696112 [Apium graveolens]|uniref:uncharacterized protein LOC141696112 n=1 Tax=Apium graveolens TaxID=4045 RepID=UPI003D7B69A5
MYNLPLWLCMKRKYMMLSTLISGPYEPGNNIDICLQPMIDDLKKLWEEREPNVYDAHSKSVFTLKAVLIWTVNDFPGYGNLSGCINKGYKACLVCGDNTVTRYLSHSRKMCYLGHRRYLDEHHPYRRQQIAFDEQQELGCAPELLSGEEVLMQQQQLEFSFGKGEGEKDRTKDNIVSHLDMIDMGVTTDLAPEIGEKRTYLPPSSFTLSKKEKKTMLTSLSNMKLPHGHASNIRNCVSLIDMKLYGLKSHDCHILLQQLLPICIRSVLPKNVRSYVRNRFYPEGCIAEGYLKEESAEFCTGFFSESSRTAGLQKDDDKFSGPVGRVTMKSVAEKEQDEAHFAVLLNNPEVEPYVQLHKEHLERIYQGKKEECTMAFGRAQSTISRLVLTKSKYRNEENSKAVSETIRWLAGKPSFSVLMYESYIIDGVRYHTKERDNARVVQNSGVTLVARTVQVSSAKDVNPVECDLTFYGIVQEIWELDYHTFKAPLFLCT